MLDRMRPGSVVVDLAVAQGGNCADTVPSKTVDRNGVKLIGANDLPCTVPNHASQLYARNLLALLQPTLSDGAADPRHRGRADCRMPDQSGRHHPSQ